jgi:hypothetical protein
MARAPKSESLTIRLDPKTRFMLEFISRLRGQTITTVVERAIAEAADAAVIHQPGYTEDQAFDETWRSYWDVNEGVRALKIARERDLHPTYDEERRLAFAKRHWPFFYTNEDAVRLMPHYIEILWPRIDEFMETHEAHRTDDFFAAGKAMQQALRDAGVEPPEWPPAAKQGRRMASAAPAFKGPSAMDDDLPF